MMDPVKVIVDALAAYLKTSMPMLQEVLTEFPNPSEKLKLPSISILTKSAPYRSDLVRQVSQGNLEADGVSAKVLYATGTYDLRLQVDLWATHKPKRSELYMEFLKVFNKDTIPQGLRLQVPEYFNQWIHFHVVGYSPESDEVSSQTGKWRIQLNVETTFRALTEKMEKTIQHIENTPEIV